MKHLIIYGGSFDPPHKGHISTALSIQHLLNAKIIFVPCKQSVLKVTSQASPKQRLEMLELCLKPYPELTIDTIELDRATPSYMVETLKSFKNLFPNDKLSLLIGMDAFNTLDKWYHWQSIFNYANIIVVNRPGHICSSAIVDKIQPYLVNAPEMLAKSGKLCFIDLPEVAISSTKIRDSISSNSDLEENLPMAVINYIRRHRLYA
jgi:nicotinate-nucleotide adenylyltransferase